MQGVPEAGVLVQRDLAVERDDLAVAALDQRVDLDQGRVFLLEDGPELLDDLDDLRLDLFGETGRVDDLLGLGRVDTGDRVDRDAGQGSGR